MLWGMALLRAAEDWVLRSSLGMTGGFTPREDRTWYEPTSQIHAVEEGDTVALCGATGMVSRGGAWQQRFIWGTCRTCRQLAAERSAANDTGS